MFQCYHYNGLEDARRRPVCTMITVTQPDDAMPMMDLTDGAQVTGDAAVAIQSVLRTKWPGARLSFGSAPPPKID